MRYRFDLYGRFDGTTDNLDDPASTEIEPPEQTPDYNWNGLRWVLAPNILTVPVVTSVTTAHEANPIPQTVTRFQARHALRLAGLFEQVDALMHDANTPALAKDAWADAQEFRRDSQTVLAMASALSLTDADLDQLFIDAAGITA